MATGESQEPGVLHEKFKGQVSASIRDSISKATGVLSQLHRVQSYLDIIRTISPARGGGPGGEGIKNALEQIRAVRTDIANLLQTVYLTEISLLSLQEVGVGGGGTALSSIMPILGDAIDSSGLSAINSNTAGTDDEGGQVVVELGDGIDFSASEDAMPPSTKKPCSGVVIVTCSGCSRKFATQRSVEGQINHCRNCRLGISPSQSDISQSTASTPNGKPSISFQSSTPLRATDNTSGGTGRRTRKRSSQPPVSCKVCSLSFVYRRCIFRHLREAHNIRDSNDMYQYIGVGQEDAEEVTDETGDTSQGIVDGSSMNVTVGSEMDPITRDGMEKEEGLEEEEVGSSSVVQVNEMSILDSLAQRAVQMEEEVEGDVQEGDQSAEGKEALTDDKMDPEALFKSGKSFMCNVCNKCFDRPYRLQRHMQIHNPNRHRVSCHICDRMFTRVDTLQNHIRSLHSDERPYKCNEENCFKAFASQSALIHHLKSHMGGKPYKCLECSSTFALLNEYKIHMRDVHADTVELRCSDCYHVFADKSGLEQHKLLEHRYECEICGKAFARVAYLETHAQVHEGPGLFNCKHCNMGFETEYAYKQHAKTHPENSRGSKKALQCPVCNLTFQHQSNLLAHLGSQEHRDKAASLGLSLNTIEGDLSPEVSALVDEVTMSEENLMQSISEGKAFQSPTPSSEEFVNSSVSDALQTIASQHSQQSL